MKKISIPFILSSFIILTMFSKFPEELAYPLLESYFFASFLGVISFLVF